MVLQTQCPQLKQNVRRSIETVEELVGSFAGSVRSERGRFVSCAGGFRPGFMA